MPKTSRKPTAEDDTDWSEEELTVAVQAYLNMLELELRGQKYNKSKINRQLRVGLLAGRSKGAIEFRMQNISAAVYDLRIPQIKGYLPARKIGPKVKETLTRLLHENGIATFAAFVPTPDSRSLEEQVAVLRRNGLGKIPGGISSPIAVTLSKRVFERDPAVKAWVLQAANGICEGCGFPAPFNGLDGFPHLEVHHVLPLSAQGSDTVSNAVALCPNCHRRCHFAVNRDEFKLALYEKIPRLVREVQVES